MISRRHALGLAAAASLLPGPRGVRAQAPATGQAWPNRFVRLVVPLAPGGPTDFRARLIAGPLSELWRQQVVLEHNPGAGGNLAAELVARSDPDGYTLLYATSSVAVNRVLYRSLNYDPIADLAPVTHLSSFSFFMFVPMSLPATSVKEFITYAKT